MWRLTSDAPASLDTLVHAAARGGVLLKRGAYQFAAMAHDDAALDLLGARLAAVIADLPPTP
jgi:glutamate-1-semialdehyde 2,1-aminomutase